MYKCVLTLIIVIDLSWSVSVNLLHGSSDINSKFKIPLAPLQVECEPTDMLTIYFPVLQIIDVIYQLRKPDGEEFPMVGRKIYNVQKYPVFNESIRYKMPKVNKPTEFRIFNPNQDGIRPYDRNHTNKNKTTVNKLYDFEVPNHKITIGPLDQEDHGNWILSVFFKDSSDEWVEMFQVINVFIEELVLLSKEIDNNKTLKISFTYPIPEIETCELLTPSRAVDKEYEINPEKTNWCGFVIRNFSKKYNGRWTIVGVGRIVHIGSIILRYSRYGLTVIRTVNG